MSIFSLSPAKFVIWGSSPFFIYSAKSSFLLPRKPRGAVCDRLAAGEDAVLVSDAGLPAISDPGEDPVRLCHERHIPVAIVPGPCAAATGAVPFTLITGIACVIYNLDNRQMSNTYVKAFRKLLNGTPFVRHVIYCLTDGVILMPKGVPNK